MSMQIDMPALSPTMEQGTIFKWVAQDNQEVQEGDVIAEIETDKAVMEMTVSDAGILHILVQEGTQDLMVGSLIAVLTEKNEDFHAEDWKDKLGSVSSTDTNQESTEHTAEALSVKPIIPDHHVAIPLEEEFHGETKMLTVRDALNEALKEELERDPNVLLMGEEVSHYDGAFKVSRGLYDIFGDDRIIDTPITEHGFTGLAVGASMLGLKPIVEYMTINFALQAADQILNSAAKTRYVSGGCVDISVVFRGPNGSSAGAGAQHSQDFVAMYAQFPGLKVIAPFSSADSKGLLKSAIRDNNPIMFLEHELLYGEKFPVPISDDWLVPIGKAKILRQGTDVTIVSYSYSLVKVLQAAQELEADGISVEVIDLRTIYPMDIQTIVESVKKTNRLISVEETHSFAGIGAELSAVLMEQAFDYLDAPVIRISREDVPLPYAKNLEYLSLPQVPDIIKAVRSLKI